jgi:hypothetical protein
VPRQGIEPKRATDERIFVRHLGVLHQHGARSRLRKIELAQQPAALARALHRVLPDRRQRLDALPRQIGDFTFACLEIELGQPFGIDIEGLRRPLAQRREQAVGAQIGEPPHPGLLRVAHAGLVDRLVERHIPVRALAHLQRGGVEVGAKRLIDRRAAG